MRYEQIQNFEVFQIGWTLARKTLKKKNIRDGTGGRRSVEEAAVLMVVTAKQNKFDRIV